MKKESQAVAGGELAQTPNRYLRWSILGALLLLAIAVTVTSWIGYRGYIDDVLTLRGALLWLKDFPYLGTTHWELRHPFVLAISGSVLTLGLSEISAIAPSIVAFILVLILLWITLTRRHRLSIAAIAILLTISTPVFAFAASTILPDMVELLFVVASLTLFLQALRKTEELGFTSLFSAGFIAGLGFITRETSAALALFYFLLFLVNFGSNRRLYIAIAAGFVIPVLADVAYVTANTGDPLYRYRIDITQHHPWPEKDRFDFLNPTPSTASLPEFEDSAQMRRFLNPGRQTSAVGPIDINPYVNPYIALWTNHEYAAIFFVAIGALFTLLASRSFRTEVSLPVRLFGLLALCWFIVQVYVLNVRPHPRYFLPLALAATLLNATWISHLLERRRHLIAAGLLLALLFAGVLSFDLHSERLHEERVLAEVAEQYGEPVFAPEGVVTAARFLLQTRAVAHLVHAGSPPAGTLFLYRQPTPATVAADESPNPLRDNWEEVERWKPRQRLLGRLLEAAGLLDRLPSSIVAKIDRPTPTIVLYRAS